MVGFFLSISIFILNVTKQKEDKVMAKNVNEEYPGKATTQKMAEVLRDYADRLDG